MINCILTTILTMLAVLALKWTVKKIWYYLDLPDEVSGLRRDLDHEEKTHELTKMDLKNARLDRKELQQHNDALSKDLTAALNRAESLAPNPAFNKGKSK